MRLVGFLFLLGLVWLWSAIAPESFASFRGTAPGGSFYWLLAVTAYLLAESVDLEIKQRDADSKIQELQAQLKARGQRPEG